MTFSRRPVSGTAFRRFGRTSLKGALVTRLTRPGLSVINTHLAANHDGDWSPGSRLYPLQKAQLAGLARIVRGVAGPAVVCGDFNVPRDSALFGEFVTDAGVTDAFKGNCPPTFRTEYLPPGAAAHCIDFILTANGARADAATVAFAGQLASGP